MVRLLEALNGMLKQEKNRLEITGICDLTPRLRQSGSSARDRSMLTGRLRTHTLDALHTCLGSSIRHNSIIVTFRTELKENGKQETVISGAAMRKLFYTALGVFKSGKAFDPVLAAQH